MDNIVYESIKRYFISLSMFGYKSYSDTYKLLYIISIRDFVYNDFRGLITEDDYRIIERSLYNVFGTTCLLPYPQFCKSKSMNKLYLGSITELAHMVQHTQELFNQHKQEISGIVDTYEQNVDKKIDTLETTIDEYKTSTDSTISAYQEQINTKVDEYKSQVVDDIATIKSTKVLKGNSVVAEIDDIITE